jgi:PKD repeat protein
MNVRAELIQKLGWVIFILCAAGLCVMLSSPARAATTYYVSTTGNDANNGTSSGTPWRTVAKVNAATFQAGDQILFARGGEWHEALAPQSSGAQGNPITFDAYGSGAKPKFWGSDVLDNSKWVSQGGNVYAITGLSYANVTEVLANHGTDANGQWFNAGSPNSQSGVYDYNSGTLRISSASNPATDGRVYTAVVRQDVVFSNGKDHLVFKNLQGDECADSSAGYVFRDEGSQDVTFDTCDAFRGGRHNFGVINATGFVGKNLYAAYAMPQISGGATFYVSYAGSESNYSNCTSTYINCMGEHFEDGGGGAYQYFVCHGAKQGPISFQNAIDHGGKFSILQENPAQLVTVTGGVIQDADYELFCDNVLTDGLALQGNSAVDCYSKNCIFQNMLMTINPSGGGPTGYGSAIVMRSGAQNNVIRFCTVAMNPSAGMDKTCLAFTVSGVPTSWYGNIFYSTGRAVADWGTLFNSGGTIGSNDVVTADYNYYNSSATFNNQSFSDWKGNGFADQHSLTGAAPFNNAAGGDYTLASGSTAIDAAAVAAANIPASDFNSNPRPQGAAADMGAFEFSSTPTIPVITSAGTASGTLNQSFSYQIAASGSPTSFGASGLPNGLTVSALGLISGSPTQSGTFTVTLTATNGAGQGSKTLTLTVAQAANIPPTISITSPSGGTLFAVAPANVAITVNAADSDGSVAKVDFYAGSAFIGTSSVVPFNFTWNNAAQGAYDLTAIVTDNVGATTTSAAVHITVGANGTVYYVSNSGSDSNDGKSTATPWKTVHQVNLNTFKPGDAILFERGGQWREQVAPNSNGTAGNPLIYGAYGAGAKPKFLGSELLTNANFQLVTGSTYKYTTAFTLNGKCGVAVNDQLLPWTGDFSSNSLSTVESTPNDYAIDASTNTIYINTNGSDPRNDGKAYAVCAREDEFLIVGRSYVTFQDLASDETARKDGGYGWRITAANHIDLQSCEAYRAGVANFGVVDSDAVTMEQCFTAYALPNLKISDIPNAAYLVNNSGSQSTQFTDCVAQHLENTQGNANYWVFATVGNGSGSNLFKNMTCTGFGGGTLYIAGNNLTTVQGGVIENGRGQFFANNILIDGLTITGSGGFDNYGANCTFQNCVFNCPQGGFSGGYAAAIALRSGANSDTIRFNTMNLGSGSAIKLLATGLATKIYGNILLSGNPVISGSVGGTGDVAQADYNFFNTTPTFTDSNTSLSAWNATGFDQHSLTGDPQFTDAANGDFSLLKTSPAIDKANLSGSQVPATDLAGTARPQGSAADIGAFEFNDNPPLVIQTATLPGGSVNVSYSQSVLAAGGSGSYTWSLASGALPGGLSLSANGVLSGTPTTAGTFNFTLQVKDSANVTTTQAYAIVIQQATVNHAPSIVSGPSGDPGSGVIGQTIHFSSTATDPDNDTLTYSWSFGDGTSGSGATSSHAYSAVGIYTVQLTVTDSGGLSDQKSIIVVISKPLDNGNGNGSGNGGSGNGGTGGNGGNGTGEGGGGTTTGTLSMTVSKIQGSASLKLANHDSAQLSGVIPNVPQGFTPAGQTIVLNIGGAAVTFTLDKTGKAKAAQGSIALKLKGKRTKGVLAFAGGDVPFTAKIQKGAWAGTWGFDPATSATKSSISMLISIQLGGNTYASTVALTYSAKANTGAKFKK